jgi:hypothetical protein
MLYESGVSYLQLRVLILLWASSFMKACSMEANPFETMFVLAVAFNPGFDLWNESMKVNTVERILQREDKEFADGDVLPMSSRPSSQSGYKFRVGHYVPSIWKSFSSVFFMCYLLYRRHQLTPDLFHFVTCFQEDL